MLPNDYETQCRPYPDGAGGSPEEGPPSLAAALRSSTVGIAIFDEDFLCRAMNRAFASMSGISEKSLIGKTLREIFGRSAAGIEDSFRRVWETGDSIRNLSISAQLCGSTAAREWIIDLFPISDDGDRTRWIGTACSEVTRRNKLLQQIFQLHGRLEAERQAEGEFRDGMLAEFSGQYVDVFKRSLGLLDRSMSLRRQVSELRIATSVLKKTWSAVPVAVEKSPLELENRRPGEEVQLAPPETDSSVTQSASAPNPDGFSAELPSPREMQVLRLLTDGKSSKEIAAVLDLSTRTVETYRARLKDKLNLRSAAEIVRYAIRNNLIEA
jgi:DNA-binding CsgD family transcriptional regulator